MTSQDKTPLEDVLKYFINYHILPEIKGNTVTIDYQDLKGFFEDENYLSMVEDHQLVNLLKNISKKIEKRIILLGMPVTHQLRDLLSQDMGKIVTFEGVIKSKSEIRPEPQKIIYQCRQCLREIKHYIEPVNARESPKIPGQCPGCYAKGSFEEIETEDIDVINIKVEEPFDQRTGADVRHFQCIVKGELADPRLNLTAGDKVRVTGIFKKITIQKGRSKKTMFIIDALNLEGIETSFKNLDISEDDILEIEKLSKDPHIFEKLKKSILPEVIGHDEIKEGIVSQAFSVAYPDRKREGIHVLLAGDPGTSKSQILLRMHRLNLKAAYAVGGGSTEAGLLGAAVRDEITGSWSIEAGLFPMCDNGLICLDELNKAHHVLLGKLNQAMEQQAVTISKAGGTVSFPAKTGVLAGLNPRKGHFDNYENVRKQIQLPDTLLDRFDLIYLLQDIPDPKKDREIVALLGGITEPKTGLISDELLQKYISYAKRTIDPEISVGAVEAVNEWYGIERTDTDPVKYIGSRDIEAIYRISRALARIELKDLVSREHAKKAIDIMDRALSTWILMDRDSGVEPMEMDIYDTT